MSSIDITIRQLECEWLFLRRGFKNGHCGNHNTGVPSRLLFFVSLLSVAEQVSFFLFSLHSFSGGGRAAQQWHFLLSGNGFFEQKTTGEILPAFGECAHGFLGKNDNNDIKSLGNGLTKHCH